MIKKIYRKFASETMRQKIMEFRSKKELEVQ
jgi:hypothetical protein